MSGPTTRAAGRGGLVADRIGRAVLVLCAVAAVVGAVGSLAAATTEDGVWRVLGLFFFAVVFALVAVWPRRLPGLWEAAVLNKLGLALLLPGVGAPDSALVDGVLAVLLLIAYVLCRGWWAWTVVRRTPGASVSV